LSSITFPFLIPIFTADTTIHKSQTAELTDNTNNIGAIHKRQRKNGGAGCTKHFENNESNKILYIKCIVIFYILFIIHAIDSLQVT